MTPHHTGKSHTITRRRETAAVRLARLEAVLREREREVYELALHAVDGGHDEEGINKEMKHGNKR